MSSQYRCAVKNFVNPALTGYKVNAKTSIGHHDKSPWKCWEPNHTLNTHSHIIYILRTTVFTSVRELEEWAYISESCREPLNFTLDYFLWILLNKRKISEFTVSLNSEWYSGRCCIKHGSSPKWRAVILHGCLNKGYPILVNHNFSISERISII
jgi:hypothetical protein